MERISKERIAYLDVLRTFAILAVILMHASSAVQEHFAGDCNGINFQFANVFDSITRFAVPLFVMISGSLMLDKKLEYRDVLKKIIHFMILFLVWSLIYTVVLIDLKHYNEYSLVGLFTNTLVDTIIGHFHFWYLFLISGIYLLIPVFQKIKDSLEIKKVYIILNVIICFVLPTVCLNSTVDSLIGKHVRDMNIGMLGGYSLYFILGYWLKGYSAKSIRLVKIATTIAGLYTVIVSNVASAYLGYEVGSFRENLTPNVLILTVGLYLIVKEYIGFNNPNAKYRNFFPFMSQNSFGVYLVHMLIMNLVSPICMVKNAFLSLPLLFIFTTVVSYFITYIMTKIKIGYLVR